MKDNYGNRLGHNEQERQELEFLRAEVPRLKGAIKQNTLKRAGSTASGQGSDESEDDSACEDQVDELPVTLNQQKVGPRMSVSAEVFGKFNVEKAYIPPVHKKSEDQVTKIKERMKNNFLFASLNPKDKQAVLNAIIGVKKAAGEVIIRQGDDGDNFYLVEAGELTCTKRMNPDDAEDTYLKTYIPGESFGELALLYNAPRAATIVAKTDCELWSLERMTFSSIIKTAVQKKREKYDQFLERVEILKMMEKTERDKLADAFKEEWFDPEEYIIRQGDNDDNSSFYMIIEGNCIATMVIQPGTPAVEVKQYGPGDYFGERSLLKDCPRAANIITKS